VRNVILLLCCLLSANVWATCDAEAVKSERTSMKGFGTWSDVKPVIDFHWRAQTRDMPVAARMALMKQFSAWGSCIYGRQRPIRFYVGNKLIARTSETGQYQSVSETFDDGPKIKAWFKTTN
jgi:hypothetical protein